LGFNQVGQLLRQRFNAHETNDQSPHRIIFVVEFDDAQMTTPLNISCCTALLPADRKASANRRASRANPLKS